MSNIPTQTANGTEQLSSYYCSSELHLSLLSPWCAIIYPWALRISRETGRLIISAPSAARYFSQLGRKVDRKTIWLAYRELEKEGFFVRIDEQSFERFPTTYNVLTHEQWAAAHPGRCVTKIEYPWSAENDPLGQRLHVKSGGVKFKAFQIYSYRKTGLSDAEIEQKFDEFLSERRRSKRRLNRIAYHFGEYLRAEAKRRAKVEQAA